MSLRTCMVAAILAGYTSLVQVSAPVDDRDLGETRPVLEPGQTPIKPFWPGEGDGGATVVSYDIKKGGKPTNCRIVTSSGIKRYDRLACDIVLRRSRYSSGFAGYGVEPRAGVHQTIRWTSLYDQVSDPEDVTRNGF